MHFQVNVKTEAVVKGTLSKSVAAYLQPNWGLPGSRVVEWNAMKAMIRGHCLGLTWWVCRQLRCELCAEEGELAELKKAYLTDPEIHGEELRMHRSTAGKWDRLAVYMLTQHR
ncbi:hypothetical protein NDU88_007325 [Pleurodeles waltl]|uniref:Uncharacterized protein n=1 Tax=Pleurodeles waltl TaxID=8319 RepID=A0AAV7PT98_PLEWA|nr:hypothetical protein NDU88_007325 [Pleurodeles waltl]